MHAARGGADARRGQLWWQGAGVLLAAICLSAPVITGSWSPAGLSADTLSLLTGLLGALSCAYTACKRTGALRRSWALFTCVLVLYVVGDVLWLVYGGAAGAPAVLSFADALYLVALVPAILGLVLYPVTRGWRGALVPLVLDATVLGAAALLVSHVLVFDEVIAGSSGLLGVAMLLVYPVTDVLLVCLVVLLLLRSVGEPRPDLVLIGLCFATYCLADNGYALLTVRGQDSLGAAVELAYTVAPLMLGLAAFTTARHRPEFRTMQRHLSGVVAPLLRDLSALAALVLFVTVFRLEGSNAWILAAVALALTGLRQLALTADRQRLRLDLERRIAARTEDLRQLTEEHERLEAMKYEFVSVVSHELRTPLTALHGSLELLADGDAGELPGSAQGIVDLATRGARRLTRLVDDIIDLERLERGVFSFHALPQALAPLLDDAVAPFVPVADERGVRLQLRAGPELASCDGDRLIQAVVNLVGNALKFTPAGGAVTVATRCVGPDVEISVSDEGRGIPAAQLDAIFERFHQAEEGDDREHAGAGLGLTITRYIVEGQGGRIWVESTVGVGSTFRFTLPRAVSLNSVVTPVRTDGDLVQLPSAG